MTDIASRVYSLLVPKVPGHYTKKHKTGVTPGPGLGTYAIDMYNIKIYIMLLVRMGANRVFSPELLKCHYFLTLHKVCVYFKCPC